MHAEEKIAQNEPSSPLAPELELVHSSSSPDDARAENVIQATADAESGATEPGGAPATSDALVTSSLAAPAGAEDGGRAEAGAPEPSFAAPRGPLSPSEKLDLQFEVLTNEFYQAGGAAAVDAAEATYSDLKALAAQAAIDADEAAAESEKATKAVEEIVRTVDVGNAALLAAEKTAAVDKAEEALAAAAASAAAAKEVAEAERSSADKAAEKLARLREEELSGPVKRKEKADAAVVEARSRLEDARTASVTDVKAREDKLNGITAELADLHQAAEQVNVEVEAAALRTAEAAEAHAAAMAVAAEADAKAAPLIAAEEAAVVGKAMAEDAAARAWADVEAKREQIAAAEARAVHTAALNDEAAMRAADLDERMGAAKQYSEERNESAWAFARAQARGEIAKQTAMKETRRRLAEYRAAKEERQRKDDAIIQKRGEAEFHLPIKAPLTGASGARNSARGSSSPARPLTSTPTGRPRAGERTSSIRRTNGSPSPARLGRSPSLKRRGNLSPLRLQGLTTEEKVVLKDRPTSRSPERVDGSAAANVYPLAAQLLDRGASRGFAVVQEQDMRASA